MLRYFWEYFQGTIDFRVYQLTSCQLPHYFETFENILSKQYLQAQLIELLDQERFHDADNLQRRYPLLAPFSQYKFQKQLYVERVLLGHLEQYNFQRADLIFKETAILPRTKYETLKAEYICRFAQIRFGLKFIQEQALAVANMADNLLIRARAGSGKTAVMACKAATLLSHFQGNPDSILILSFNKKAAKEIGERISKQLKIKPNSRTFHSLAHRIVQPIETVLFDDAPKSMVLTEYIQELVKELQDHNPEVRSLIRQFLRNEFRTGLGTTHTQKNLQYQEQRNSLQVTLKGERVKSNGEKYIADFLFENNISYKYEEPIKGPDGTMHPDFTLWDPRTQKKYILEHWGIDENDPIQSVPDDWTMSWAQYRTIMEKKRQWFRAKNIPLIETSIIDLRNGREAFEFILAQRLLQADIDVEHLPEEEILDKLTKGQTTRIASLIQQAISRAKRMGLSSIDVRERFEGTSELDERTVAFWKLAIAAYTQYEIKLIQDGFIDFDELIIRSVRTIEQSEGHCHFKIDDGRSISVRDLQYLLIDEYQDFSQSFCEIVQTMRRYNPQLKILCVGDDWQAINGFAGSNLHYFHNFRELFSAAETTNLLTNHRSQSEIVRQSNQFMQGKGEAAIYRNDLGKGKVGRIFIDTFENDSYFHVDGFDANFLAAKFVQACYKIVTASENQEKKCVILSRTNWIYRRPVAEFKKKLKEILDEEQYKLIEFSTIHSYKGLEADIAIIADASRENFPFIHPDNQLLALLDVTVEEVIQEEERLFYVAMTRAKQQLYVFTEQDTMSSFVKHLPCLDWEDILPSLSRSTMWVGARISGAKETYVYDPDLFTAAEGWVCLYHIERDCITKYQIDTIKPLLKTITRERAGELALQQYVRWKNQKKGYLM